MSYALLSVGVGFVSLLIVTVVLLILGICPGSSNSNPLSNQVNIKFGDPGSPPLSPTSKRRAVVPNINPQKPAVTNDGSANTGLGGFTGIKKIPQPTAGPIEAKFTKLRKGTGFDNEGFEQDLDMAINDLSGGKMPKFAPVEDNSALPPPPALTASMKMDGYQPPAPPPSSDFYPPPPTTNTFSNVDIAPPPPPPEEEEGAPSQADIENALLKMPKLSDVDLVPLHELEIDMADERSEEAKPKEQYIGGLKNRQKSIFRPSKQYLISKGTNPEDIRTLPRDKKRLPRLKTTDPAPISNTNIDKKL